MVADIPKRSYGNIDSLIPKEIGQILGGPCLSGFPVDGTSSYNERGVSGYKSHKLERTGLLVKLMDVRAVEFIVGDDQVCDGINIMNVLLFVPHDFFLSFSPARWGLHRNDDDRTRS